jgi:hypothetical protein
MKNLKGTDPPEEDLERYEPRKFRKNDFTIFMEEMSDGIHRFHVKSGEVFKKFIKSIGNALKYFRFKFLNIFKDKSIEEEQYEISRNLYRQNKKLKRKLQEIEMAVDKTQNLATQIKGDTETIMLDIKIVVFMVESQMEKIENLDEYMMANLGSDWNQIRNNWSMYKEGEITRGDFVKVALRKLGKNFLGIFVNVVS